MSDRRLRILVSAYACEPGAGSEPGIGWNFATALASRHEVWVLTRGNNRLAIEAALSRDPVPGLNLMYFDLPGWQRWWKRGSRGVHAYYWLWQYRAHRSVRATVAREPFDIAQHITFGQYWSPSFLRSLGLPYVWGPVGGGEEFPVQLRDSLSSRSRRFLALKSALRGLAENSRAVRRTARSSRVALATTPETARRLRRLGATDVRVVSAAALSPDDLIAIERTAERDVSPAPRFVVITRLNGRKGESLGLRAFAESGIPGATLEIFGDGPERSRLEELARRAGVAERVVFWGALPRAEILARLAGATALLHLSPEESGGFVCLEAMSAGVPPIILSAGGPAVLVPPEAGLHIPVSDTESVVNLTADALRKLATDPSVLRRLGAAGRQHVRLAGTWASKIGIIEDIYRDILKSGTGEPADPDSQSEEQDA